MVPVLACLMLALGADGERSALPPEPQNVVVILVDDVGVDMIGAYEGLYAGHPAPGYENTTPSIDYLAQTGLLFRNAWTNPVCSPTRAQILTGMPARENGVGVIVRRVSENHQPGLRHGFDTIPTILRRSPLAPYDTAAVGKWHLTNGLSHPPPSGRIHALGSLAKPWFHRYAGSMFNLNHEGFLHWTKTFATPIDPLADQCAPPLSGYCETFVFDYATQDTADDAIHLVQTLEEPFFLYVAFNAAHVPLTPPSTPLTPASCSGVSGDPVCVGSLTDDPFYTRCMVQWLDNEIGRIVCAIEGGAQAPERDTTIVFLGDNGTTREATVAPFDREHAKATVYQGGINVPFIVKSTLVDASLVGGTTAALVSATDILATVAEIAQAPLPPDPLGLRDSVSFMPVLAGTSPSTRDFVYAEHFRSNFVPTKQGGPPNDYELGLHDRAIRDRDGFKLIQRVYGTGDSVLLVEELYELAVDPFETQDRMPEANAGLEPYASRYLALSAQLDGSYPHLVTTK